MFFQLLSCDKQKPQPCEINFSFFAFLESKVRRASSSGFPRKKKTNGGKQSSASSRTSSEILFLFNEGKNTHWPTRLKPPTHLLNMCSRSNAPFKYKLSSYSHVLCSIPSSVFETGPQIFYTRFIDILLKVWGH